jgi:hypothetical protein
MRFKSLVQLSIASEAAFAASHLNLFSIAAPREVERSDGFDIANDEALRLCSE